MTEPDDVTPDEPVEDLTAAEPVTDAGDDDGSAAEPAGAEEPKSPKNPTSSRGRGVESAGNAPSAAKLKPGRRLSSRPAARPNVRLADAAATPKPVARGSVRGLKLFLLSLLLIVVITGIGLILYFTPVMSARSIVVNGIGAVSRDEVLDAAHVKPGTPLLQIDTDGIADRVAAIRRVASAHVQRDYPSALMITVVERIPVVVKDLPDGPHLFDRDGVDFATAPPPPALPYIDVDNPGPADPATKAALAVLTALRPEVVAQVSRIAAPSVASITLTLADGRTVIWGTNERTEEKALKLAALLTRPGRTYDVSSPDLPTVR